MKDNVVVNLIVWDGGNWAPPEGHTLMREPEGIAVSTGWRLVDGEWIEPDNIVYTPPPDPAPEQ